ncbi:MAG: sugar ABC transporter substrate-binding protein [Rhizobiales bacterium]|nr:sugar ABC transporter substrate-binding protein [Hyphomicrobiales bacterium]
MSFVRLGMAALVAAVTLTGAVEAQAQNKNLLWVQPMRDHPVHRLMQAGFLSKCQDLGYTCEVVGNPSATNYDVAGSIPLAEAALARTKFGAVAVYGPGPDIYPYIGKLGNEGIPVVTWHVLPPEGSVAGLKAATGEDIADAGNNAALAMGEKLGGKGTIALTQGSYNETENVMADSFRKTMAEKYPDIKILETQVEGFEPSAAEAKAVGILQGNPDVTGAFSTTGNGVQTWSGAARKAGRDVTIIGMDYIRQNLDIIKSGAAYGLVAQPLFEEGAKTAELAAALAEGKEVPYLNPLPAKVITAADLDPYYAILDSAGQ